MENVMRFQRVAVGIVAVAAMSGLAACGSSNNASGGSSPTSSAAAAAPSADGSPSSATSTSGQFGPACSSVPTSGPGSFAGMAQAPVATAASNNPALSTLVAAVKAAGLVDTLNNAKGVTVFAPDNDAFAKIPAAQLKSVLANKAELTKILTYHVVPKAVTPADLAAGNFPTLEGGAVQTSGSDDAYKVNAANVVCGNVQTSNATVYIIDSVLMPTS
jgi:uncharacterized surface protein with fasciclin (FAS1) repeats